MALPTRGIPGSAPALPVSWGTGWVWGAGMQLRGCAASRGSPAAVQAALALSESKATQPAEPLQGIATAQPVPCPAPHGTVHPWRAGATDLLGHPSVAPIFPVRGQYLEPSGWLSMGATAPGSGGVASRWSRPPAPRTSPVLLSHVWFNAERSVLSCLTKQGQRWIPPAITSVTPCALLPAPFPSGSLQHELSPPLLPRQSRHSPPGASR